MSDLPPDEPIPSEADWRSEPWDLDTECAYKNLFGKTIAEAVRLFEENSIQYQEDVMFMPGIPFRYYVRAYARYLLSDAARGDSDAASCFIGVIDMRSQQQPEHVRAAWSSIEPVLARLAGDQGFYAAGGDIYGEFRARMRPIVERGFPVTFAWNR